MNAEAIRARLLAHPFPEKPAIADWEVTTGPDSIGEPGVWVYVTVNDEHLEAFQTTWQDLRRRIRIVVSESAPEAFAYIRLQAASEVAQVAANA